MQAIISPPTSNTTQPELPATDHPEDLIFTETEDSTGSLEERKTAISGEPIQKVSDKNEPITPLEANAGTERRSMQWKRFLTGLLLTATGISLMLIVTAGMIVDMNDDRISLPVVAVSMIIGLMMLGGGFGIMATAAPSFDDGEFDRLMADSRPAARD